jgi:hypothetical protein
MSTDDVVRRLLEEVPEPEIPKFASTAKQKVPTPPPTAR